MEEFDVPASSVALDEEPRSDLLEEDGAGAADAPDADRESKQKMARRSRVVKLDLNDNNMGGQLPEGALAALTELSELMIDSNRIRGPFPSTIGSLWHIRKLNMAYNHFSGPIPSSICRLKKLRKLLLQDNHLSGSVPEWYGCLLYHCSSSSLCFSSDSHLTHIESHVFVCEIAPLDHIETNAFMHA